MGNTQGPHHIAIVMDGNGRWAKERGHARVFGHIRGAKRVKPIVKEADRVGAKALTLFAFSSENWIRPQAEIDVLWKILKKYLIREADELDQNNVQFKAIGQVERLPEHLQKVIRDLEVRLSKNDGLLLTFAVSYGSQDEITHAMKTFAQDCVDGKRKPSDLTTEEVYKYLWTKDMGELANVDLMIRTSGESRISNFLLWQSAYAELCFEEISWPEFMPAHLRQAVDDYRGRDRRYGGIEAVSSQSSTSLSV